MDPEVYTGLVCTFEDLTIWSVKLLAKIKVAIDVICETLENYHQEASLHYSMSRIRVQPQETLSQLSHRNPRAFVWKELLQSEAKCKIVELKFQTESYQYFNSVAKISFSKIAYLNGISINIHSLKRFEFILSIMRSVELLEIIKKKTN